MRENNNQYRETETRLINFLKALDELEQEILSKNQQRPDYEIKSKIADLEKDAAILAKALTPTSPHKE